MLGKLQDLCFLFLFLTVRPLSAHCSGDIFYLDLVFGSVEVPRSGILLFFFFCPISLGSTVTVPANRLLFHRLFIPKKLKLKSASFPVGEISFPGKFSPNSGCWLKQMSELFVILWFLFLF